MQYLVSVIDDRAASGTLDEMAAIGEFNHRVQAEGFWVFEAADLDAAIRLATEGSKVCNRRVEVRPFLIG